MLAENYLQHAEHYQRMIGVWDAEAKEKAIAKGQQQAAEAAKDGADQSENKIASKSDSKPAPRKRTKAAPKEADLGLPASMLTKAPVEEKSAAKTKEEA